MEKWTKYEKAMDQYMVDWKAYNNIAYVNYCVFDRNNYMIDNLDNMVTYDTEPHDPKENSQNIYNEKEPIVKVNWILLEPPPRLLTKTWRKRRHNKIQ